MDRVTGLLIRDSSIYHLGPEGGGKISEAQSGVRKVGSAISTFRQHVFSTGLEYQGQLHSRVRVTAGASFDGTATPKTGPFPSRDPIYAWGLAIGQLHK
jgi:hypothetical protein